jgi:hypothetical protein
MHSCFLRLNTLLFPARFTFHHMHSLFKLFTIPCGCAILWPPRHTGRYCECFASNRLCTEACNCCDCCNTCEGHPLRKQAISATLDKNRNAFRPKGLLTDGATGEQARESPMHVVARAATVWVPHMVAHTLHPQTYRIAPL